ncbi:DUF2277 domain-containing protein [Stackebrandtia soli]|uniref:DUF2277 domain-containing protein n=1 Tax=Stackebrandtia soli TaxID=1892856 RepID=UPI0039EA00A7
MCRNIKRLYNLEPTASPEEIRGAAVQYVRKVSGSTKPSAVNQDAFDAAVDAVADATATLLESLRTSAPARTREQEAEQARKRAERRLAAQS